MKRGEYVTRAARSSSWRMSVALAAVVPLVLIAFSLSAGEQAVRAVQVDGAWMVKFNGPLVCSTCEEFPLTLGLSVPEEVVSRGVATEINVGFSSLVPNVITLRKPVSLRVRIMRRLDSGCCPVIWEGVLPPLPGSISPGSFNLRFLWDQRDSLGLPVPRGKYLAAIVFPVTIAHTIGGTPGEERLTKTSGHLLGGEIAYGFIEIR